MPSRRSVDSHRGALVIVGRPGAVRQVDRGERAVAVDGHAAAALGVGESGVLESHEVLAGWSGAGARTHSAARGSGANSERDLAAAAKEESARHDALTITQFGPYGEVRVHWPNLAAGPAHRSAGDRVAGPGVGIDLHRDQGGTRGRATAGVRRDPLGHRRPRRRRHRLGTPRAADLRRTWPVHTVWGSGTSGVLRPPDAGDHGPALRALRPS